MRGLLLLILSTLSSHAQLAGVDEAAGSNYVSYRMGLEQKVFASINEYRLAHRLPEMAWNSQIAEIARNQSREMAAGSADFIHTDFRERMKNLKPQNWQAATENVLQGGDSNQISDVALQAWLSHPQQLENICGNYNSTGIGVWLSDQRTVFFTQIFARISVSIPNVDSPQSAGSSSASSLYRGFSIDTSTDFDMKGVAQVVSTVKEQIDKVYSVGLSEDILDFFRMVPIKIASPAGVFQQQPALYSNSEKNVQVSNGLITLQHKPVLLHQLLNALYDQKLSGVSKPTPIDDFYRNALQMNIYSAQSNMMSNDGEYFACAGTAFLYGVAIQEPFHREKILGAQPGLAKYFKKLFGPAAGSYQGSLTQ